MPAIFDFLVLPNELMILSAAGMSSNAVQRKGGKNGLNYL
jgi:hypothetical protein